MLKLFGLTLLLLAPALATAQGAIGVASGGGGAIPECSGAQSAFGVCLDTATGELTWEGATADGFEARLSFTDPTVDGSLIFNTNSLTAARTLTVPNASGTIVLPNVQYTWTTDQNIDTNNNWVVGGGSSFRNAGAGAITFRRASLTPPAPQLMTGTISNSWVFHEEGDATSNFANGPGGASATTAPTLIFFSQAAGDQAHYSGLAYYGTAGKWVTTLTESSATAVLSVPVAQGDGSGGVLRYTVFAADATDQQSRHGSINYAVLNKAGAEECTLPGGATEAGGATDETEDGSVFSESAGASTLTYDITCAVGVDAITISVNAVSSLTQTTLEFRGRVDHVGAGEPLPQ